MGYKKIDRYLLISLSLILDDSVMIYTSYNSETV